MVGDITTPIRMLSYWSMVAPRAPAAEPVAVQETLMAVALWARGEEGVTNETIACPAGAYVSIPFLKTVASGEVEDCCELYDIVGSNQLGNGRGGSCEQE